MRASKRQKTVIVDFSRGSIKMALAESACEAVRFEGITRIALPEGHGVADLGTRSEAAAAQVTELIRAEVRRRGWQGQSAACLLSGVATSTQSFLLPPMPDGDLRRAIALKLGDTLHFDLEQASFGHRRVHASDVRDDAPALTLVAVARIDAIQRAVSSLRRAGLRPVAIGSAAESLANLSQCTSLWNTEEASIHVDVGRTTSILNLFEGNQLRFSREVDVAGETFTQALTRPILTAGGALELDYQQATRVRAIAGLPDEDDETELSFGIRACDLVPLLEPAAQRLSAEIERSIDYLCGLLDRPAVDRVVLSGTSGRMRNLDRFLGERLGVPVVYCDPVARAMAHWRLAVRGEVPQDLAGYSAILGYSLGQHEPINLLPREERVDQALQRVARTRRLVGPPLAAAGVCLALAGVPARRTFDRSTKMLERAAESLDRSWQEREQRAASHAREAQALEDLWRERGLVPNWDAILRELAVLAPPEVQLTSLELDGARSAPVLRVEAQVHDGAARGDALGARFVLDLNESPFFDDVHVVESSVARDGVPGRFEARLRIVAGEEVTP